MEEKKIPMTRVFFKQFKNKEEFTSFFNDLFKEGVEEMLKGELDEHLGYEKHSKEGHNTGNSRNGSYPKKVASMTSDLRHTFLRIGLYFPKYIRLPLSIFTSL